MTDATEAPRYGEAMEELESILEDLENDAIDVDELAAKVKRASALIKMCRERLTKTRLEIQQVVDDLEGFEDGAAEGEQEA